MSVDRRKLIIDAAAKSFSMFGYKATTMDQVAKLANVGKGTIYTFFRNKDELFHDIVSAMVKEMIHEAEDAIVPGKSFGENVHSALYRILEFRSEHQLMLKLLQEEKEMGTLAVLDMLNHIENEIIVYLKSKIEAAEEKGLIRECDSEITAFLLLKTYIALVSDWERRHKPLSSEKIADLMKFYLLKGLSK
ncbi:TetR/AcrR family transcriptional regulator [Metabacillus sp. RGM 3146]|uniref:TetR/AcrR family transcriptional regulator n=1 Tax=Metabacillus sp. RGM 3146 TaxID=3401092 RepID=UPI003B9D1A4F